MDANLLIDAVVRQTTVLIAQLATSAGNRASLARTANQIFLNLVQELKRQGLGNKVIADMFGLALRTYHDKVQRLSESQTFRGRSLWEAVHQFIQEQDSVTQPQVLLRFGNDDERIVRSVLADLVDSGLASRTGKGDQATFRPCQTPKVTHDNELEEAICQLVHVIIHRFGPLGATQIQDHIQLDTADLDAALKRLLDSDRVTLVTGPGPEPRYQAEHCVIPVGSTAGWEAAVFDHYQAMVTGLCTKLDSGRRKSSSGESIGGSTYTFDLWEGHPLEAEVGGHLQRLRGLSVALRCKVEAHNAEYPAPLGAESKKFISYVGQTLITNKNKEE